MKTTLTLLLIIAFVGLASSVPWDFANEPKNLNLDFNLVFGAFPKKAQLQKIPWSGDYWASYKSGIAHRWNPERGDDFTYTLFTQDKLKKMTWKQLSQLSPAEKFDIYNARYDFPTVKAEWLRTNSRQAKWEGICNGWAPASGHLDEPSNINATSKDGIVVPFGSADLKALLSYNAGVYNHHLPKVVGLRCDQNLTNRNSQKQFDPACLDLNPGALHVILTGLIAGFKQFFIIDVDRSDSVWNQPVYKYSYIVRQTRAPQQFAPQGTKKEVLVDMTLGYTQELTPSFFPDGAKVNVNSRKWRYWLELGEGDKILGGNYVSWERPDFLWTIQKPEFINYFSSLQTLYEQSTKKPKLQLENFASLRSENHREMVNPQGTIELSNYETNQHQTWSISPSRPSSIQIDFVSINTKNNEDMIKIYEGSHGEGPLLAVYHGSILPKRITFPSPILIKFVSFNSGHKGSFALRYEVLTQE
eukprot:TRINITY_DN5025_c0_g1_i1.p1 TRINITY_DN5025_c0_g1~~TRINITY_DN5025_c0_g1_i1.p1  ORF type:complete len:473 (-),score=117.18 TRINITY_DN5025_c0_g1_i1:60-1478(-)